MQKARLARIRLAKATSGAAFLSKKRAVESRLMAQESGHLTAMMMAAAAAAAASSGGGGSGGNEGNNSPGSGPDGTTPGSGPGTASTCHPVHHVDDSWLREEDIFELQHHHLLRCLEKATVSLPSKQYHHLLFLF